MFGAAELASDSLCELPGIKCPQEPELAGSMRAWVVKVDRLWDAGKEEMPCLLVSAPRFPPTSPLGPTEDMLQLHQGGTAMRTTGVWRALLLVLGLALILSACGPREREAKVLLIFSYHAEYAWHAEEARGTEEVLQREGIPYEAFYLDTKRQTSAEWKEQIASEAREKIDDYDPSLVIAFDDNACALVAAHYVGESLPFVFCGVNEDPSEYGFPAENITGVLERPDVTGSVELLLQLVPDAESVALVLDASPSAIGFAEGIEGLPLPVEIAEVYLTDAFEEWQTKVLELQSVVDAIGLFTYHTIKRSGETESMSPEEVLQWTLENSALPEFAPLDLVVEGGALCGVALSGYEQGTTAAEIGIRILAGEKPADIPIVTPRATRALVNSARAAQLGVEIPEEIVEDIELLD